MTHKNIRIPTQNAHDIMEKLGSIDNSLEFVDLNQELIETKKPYNKMISRCDELEKAFIKFDTVIQGRNNLVVKKLKKFLLNLIILFKEEILLMNNMKILNYLMLI